MASKPGDELVRKMAQMMMQGAVMLDKTCPLDGVPLLRLKTGEIVCPVHGRVLIVSSDEEARDLEVEGIIREARYRAAKKVLEGLERGDASLVREWLDIVERAERILSLRRSDRGQGQMGGEPARKGSGAGQKRG